MKINFDEEKWLINFSEKLKKKMDEFDISISDLSKMTDLNKSTLSKYINCQAVPTVKSFLRITHALNMDIRELIYFDR